MKSTIIALAVGGVLAGLAALAYTPPTAYVENTERVFTGVGKVLELVATDDPNYLTYAKSTSRVFLKDKDTFRVIVEINGTITEVVTSGTAVCKPSEVQSVYIKARIENATASPPDAPVLEVVQ